jgi:3-carboxy-cis,cis-muconate cycloisomerase
LPGERVDDGGLFGSLLTTDALVAATSDRAWLQAMLDAEVALARAEEALDLVPEGTARRLEQAADASSFSPTELGRAGRAGGNPVIPLVAALRRQVDPSAADWVHHGATSQDIVDTAAMLVARRAAGLIDEDLGSLCAGCAALAERHRSTLMVGRTLLQHALPITFGLKAAGWLVAAARARATLRERCAKLPIQLGGAAGTLAALGDQGLAVAEAMAAELGLSVPPLPWHADRTVVVELGSALGLVAGVGAKVAVDVALLMQTEVGEASEPAEPGRGTSSTLPHKRNPVGAARVLAAHRQASTLVSVLFGAMANEHERGVGGWQAEWETLIALLRLAGGIAATTAETVGGLEVDPEAMAANLARTGGVLLSERVVGVLTGPLGRERATAVVQSAAARALAGGGSFAQELAAEPLVGAELSEAELAELLDPHGYLGSVSVLIDRALAAGGCDAGG